MTFDTFRVGLDSGRAFRLAPWRRSVHDLAWTERIFSAKAEKTPAKR